MTGTVILDVDGSILDWKSTYIQWLTKFDLIGHIDPEAYSFRDAIKVPGYTKDDKHDEQFVNILSEIFNQSFMLRKLPPIPGAVEAIHKLHKAGYTLKVVSSYTTQYEAMKSREYNLNNVFGDVFQEITSLPLHSSKKQYLEMQDKDSYFIEDSVSHIKDAIEVGFHPHRCFLIPADWNLKPYDQMIDEGNAPCVRRCKWNTIVNTILGQ